MSTPTRAFQAYGPAGQRTASTPRAAARAYFDAFPRSRKCSVIEGESDGPFFTMKFGRASHGEWPRTFPAVTPKGGDALPEA